MNNIYKRLRPVNSDISLEYKCPNCEGSHWLFFRETKLKNFKIACECGSILIPQQTHTVKLIYNETVKAKIKTEHEVCGNSKKQQYKEAVEEKEDSTKTVLLSERTLSECCKTLKYFGFDKQEAIEKITHAHSILNSDNIKDLVDYILKNIERK